VESYTFEQRCWNQTFVDSNIDEGRQLRVLRSNNVLNIQDTLSVMFAASMQDFEHPGFTNTFLNRTKHPIAVRYNDVSCLENHHAAAGFLCLLNADPDPLQNISESQYQQIRKAIVRMILSTDVSNHLTELTIFKTNSVIHAKK
jgi:cAMP-specific phosphodiesterase 4